MLSPISGCGDEGSRLHSLTSQKTVIFKLRKSLLSKIQELFTIKRQHPKYCKVTIRFTWDVAHQPTQIQIVIVCKTMPFSLFTTYLLAQTKEKNSSLYNGLNSIHLISSGFGKIKTAL